MKSLKQKIDQCAGLIDTDDVDDKTSDFLRKCVNATADRRGDTRWMTPGQVEYLESVYRRHFA